MNKSKAQTPEHVALLEKVRKFYLKGKGKDGPTQKAIAAQIGIDHVYLNRIFAALESGERIRKMNSNNIEKLRAFVERI